jgi:hypothetical protein
MEGYVMARKILVKAHKQDSVGLFSGRYKKQVFKGKKDKLAQEERRRRHKKYEGDL